MNSIITVKPHAQNPFLLIWQQERATYETTKKVILPADIIQGLKIKHKTAIEKQNI